ncbi:MAG: hypothetical protein RLZZ30_1998, partial [Bacteroidota bacterium]
DLPLYEQVDCYQVIKGDTIHKLIFVSYLD